MNRTPGKQVQNYEVSPADKLLQLNVFLSPEAVKEGHPLYQYLVKDPAKQQELLNQAAAMHEQPASMASHQQRDLSPQDIDPDELKPDELIEIKKLLRRMRDKGQPNKDDKGHAPRPDLDNSQLPPRQSDNPRHIRPTIDPQPDTVGRDYPQQRTSDAYRQPDGHTRSDPFEMQRQSQFAPHNPDRRQSHVPQLSIQPLQPTTYNPPTDHRQPPPLNSNLPSMRSRMLTQALAITHRLSSAFSPLQDHRCRVRCMLRGRQA